MRKILIPVVATLLTGTVMVYQARTVEPVLCEAPVVHLTEIDGYASEALPASEAERQTLPEDTIVEKRTYTASNGATFFVSVVIGGRSKSSIHRPEMCLPSQGFQMSSPRDLDVSGFPWHRVDLVRQDSAPMGFAYTFFNQEGFRTSSHIRRIFRDVWDRSVLGRIDRWVMVTVHATSADTRSLASFLAKLEGKVIR